MKYLIVVVTTFLVWGNINNEARANNAQAKGEMANKDDDRTPHESDSKELPEDQKPEDDNVFTIQDFNSEFIDKLTHETWRKRLEFSYPEWYESTGMGEVYMNSLERYRFERGVRNDLKDAGEHALIEAAWHSPFGQSIQEVGENLKLRFFARQEKESDFESSNRTRYGFFFGEDGERLINFGAELGDKIKILAEFETGRMEHEISLRTDLLNPKDENRLRWKMRGNHWFVFATEYDWEDEQFRFYFDDLEVADDWFLSAGLTYHGQDDHIGYRYNSMEAEKGSVTLSFNAHGQFSDLRDLFRPFNPMNWRNPFKRKKEHVARHDLRRRQEQSVLASMK